MSFHHPSDGPLRLPTRQDVAVLEWECLQRCHHPVMELDHSKIPRKPGQLTARETIKVARCSVSRFYKELREKGSNGPQMSCPKVFLLTMVIIAGSRPGLILVSILLSSEARSEKRDPCSPSYLITIECHLFPLPLKK